MRRADWSAAPAWSGGPAIGDLVLAFLPLVRARFLQGHVTLALHLAVAGDEQWSTLDFETGELSHGTQGYPRGGSGLDVALTMAAMSDLFGPAPSGYAMEGCPDAIPIDCSLTADGSLPDGLVQERDAAVDEAVAALAGLLGGGAAPPRADHAGLLWVFDPQHWWGAGPTAGTVAATALDVLRREPADFIRGQLYDDRRKHRRALLGSSRPPTLGWLLELESFPQDGAFWGGVGQALQGRGQAHRLTMGDRGRLSSQRHGPSWLEAIVELLLLGVLDFDGLLEGADPVEPVVEHAVDERTVELTVWGEETIRLSRIMNLPDTDVIAGAYAWDYAAGTAEQPPRVVVVAGRGIQIEDRWKGSFPWHLELVRVQDDSAIPVPGELVDLTPILSPALLSPDPAEAAFCSGVRTAAYPLAAVWPRPNGLYLEYPIWGSDLDPSAPEEPEGVTSGAIPFSLEITVDPRSGTQGFLYDVHYYRYQYGPNYRLGGAHVPVWVAEGVEIACSGAPMDGMFASTSQAASTTFYQSCWTASAEFWEANGIGPLGKPLARRLSVTPRLAWHDDVILSDIPRFGDQGVIQLLDDGTQLSKKTYRSKTFKYRDSALFDLLDLMIGFIPLLGDAVDIAELGLAWTTGKDKWGRPVTNFQLGLMTIGAAVPLVSGSFLADVGGVVAARGDGLLQLQAPGGVSVLFRSGTPELATDEDALDAALALPRSWDEAGWLTRTPKRSGLTGDVLGQLADDADEIAAYGARLASDAGDEWIALPDLLDATGQGFRAHPLQADFLRWSTRNPGADPDSYAVPANLVGRSRQILTPVARRRVLTGAERAERRLARAAADPSAVGRPRAIGVVTPLASASGPSMAGHVNAYIDEALGPGSRSRIWSTQVLRRAPDVVNRPPAFFHDGIVRLLRHVSPTGSLSDIPEAALARLVGFDYVGGERLSLGERGARAGHALLDAHDELLTAGIDPDVQFVEALLPALRAFVRSRVVNYGRAVGSRFEFRFAADLESAVPASIGRRHQLDLPALRRRMLVSGPDTVLYHDGLAYLAQLKAYARFSDLIDGTLMWSFDDVTGQVLRVWGPTVLAQPMRDLTRARLWNHLVPGPGIIPPADGRLPADLTGWVPLSRIHALVIDDEYMSRSMCELLSSAVRRGGRVDIMRDVDAPPAFLQQLIDVYGPNPVVRDEERLFEVGWHWIHDFAGDAEHMLNQTLREPEVWQAIGDIFEYRIVLASERAAGVLPALGMIP